MSARDKLEAYLKDQRLQRDRDRVAGADQLSAQARYARMRLGRAAMPPAEGNDSDAGEGARRKLPMRYE